MKLQLGFIRIALIGLTVLVLAACQSAKLAPLPATSIATPKDVGAHDATNLLGAVGDVILSPEEALKAVPDVFYIPDATKTGVTVKRIESTTSGPKIDALYVLVENAAGRQAVWSILRPSGTREQALSDQQRFFEQVRGMIDKGAPARFVTVQGREILLRDPGQYRDADGLVGDLAFSVIDWFDDRGAHHYLFAWPHTSEPSLDWLQPLAEALMTPP